MIREKRAGRSDKDACATAHVSTVSLYKWLRRGRLGVKPYAEFARLYDEAERIADELRERHLRTLAAS